MTDVFFMIDAVRTNETREVRMLLMNTVHCSISVLKLKNIIIHAGH